MGSLQGASAEGTQGVHTTIAQLDEAYHLPAGHRRLFLVRHARPVTSSSGPYDPELGARGQAQAERLAQRLATIVDGEDVELVASSRRAAQTADIVGERLGLVPVQVEAIAEVGGLGAPVPVVVSDAPGVVTRLRWKEPDGPFRPRAIAGVVEVLERTSATDVVAITHGGFINAYVAELLQVEGEFFFYPRHTSLTVVRLHEGQVALDRLNDAAHLEPRW